MPYHVLAERVGRLGTRPSGNVIDVAVPATMLDRIDRASQWVAAERRRAARSGEIAARHDAAAKVGPAGLREFHDRAAAANRQMQARHLVSAGIQAAYVARLRARVVGIIEAPSRNQASIASQYGLTAVRGSRGRLEQQGTRDDLTNLPNRYLFAEHLAAAVETGVSGPHEDPVGHRLVMFLISLDNLTEMDDRLGPRVADRLLVALAQRLSDTVAGHFVARTDSDEFVVLLDHFAGEDDAAGLADMILAAVGEPIHINDHDLMFSASIGVVDCTAHAEPAEIMKAAVISLAWAQNDGGGRWAHFDRDRHNSEMARDTLAAELPAAIDRGELRLDYQPIISLADGAVAGAEALVRWQHPTLGRLGPDEFVKIAEETGSVVQLGHTVMAQACAEAASWRPISPGRPYVSVNVAARQLHDTDLVGEVSGLLTETGLPASRLQLEITEGAIVRPDGRSVDTLRALVDMGVAVVIDDFGTGYSNLSYLRRLPVNAIKIDRSFVAALYPPDGNADTANLEILVAILSLAHALGLAITAEGVESVAQAELLQSLACDLAQGWYFDRPLSPADIEQVLAANVYA